MNKTQTIFALTLPCLALPGVHAADGANLDYSFVQVGYNDYTIDVGGGGGDVDVDGIRLLASFDMGSDVFLYTSYQTLNGELFGIEVDATDTRIGIGKAFGIAPGTDVFANIGFVQADIEVETLGSDDDNGYAADLGVRSLLSPEVEVFGAINYVDVFDGSETGLTAGLRYVTSGAFSLLLAYETADDTDGYLLAARFDF